MIKGTRTQNYLKGLASGYVVTFATVTVGLFLVPFVLRYLDREQYAVFTLAGEVLMWLGLLELGVTAVLTVKAAQLSGKPNQEELNRLASTTFFAQCGVALLIGLVGSFVTVVFPDFFGLRPDLQRDATLVMALMVVGAGLKVATQTFSSLLIAHQQIHIDNAIRLALLVIRTALTVWLLALGYGLVSLAIAHLVAVIATGLLAVLRVYRLLPDLRLGWRYFSWDILKQTGGTGVWFSLGGLAGILIMNLDKIVTAKVVGVEMVTTLALTGRLYILAWQLLQQVTNAARPALAQIVGEGQMDMALKKYKQFLSLNSFLALVAAFGILSANGRFVTWWVGGENYGGIWLDSFLALNFVLHAWVLPSRAMTTATLRYVRENSISRCVEGVLNLIFSVVLGRVFGLPGIAVATTIAAIAVSLWYLPILVGRIFGKPFKVIVGLQSLRLTVGIVVGSLILNVLSEFCFSSSFEGAFFSGFLVSISVAVVLMWVIFSKDELKMFRQALMARGVDRFNVK